MTTQSTIKVAVRIRPLLSDEILKNLSCEKLEVEGNTTIKIKNRNDKEKAFLFDQVFDTSQT